MGALPYRRRYRVTTDSQGGQPAFENRLPRQFAVEAPDWVYAGDIPYVGTAPGWLYLAVVIDPYSRKVVDWSTGRRLPKGPLIHDSDGGVQYASRAFRKLLDAHGIAGRISGKGDCWDSAVVESFLGSLKFERINWRRCQTREEARADIVDYITTFHNSRRLYSYLGYQRPGGFDRNGQLASAAYRGVRFRLIR